jgi:hypothetical protein
MADRFLITNTLPEKTGGGHNYSASASPDRGTQSARVSIIPYTQVTQTSSLENLHHEIRLGLK